MADVRRGGRRLLPWPLVVVLVLLATPVLGGCDAGRGGRDRVAAVEAMLRQRAEAVLARDIRGYLDTVDDRERRFVERQREIFTNLREVPLGSWSYRLASSLPSGDRVRAEIELSYRLRGHDTAAATSVDHLTLTERDGRWYVAGVAAPGAAQLWDQGPVTVVRGERSIVLGVGRSRRSLGALAEVADRAVPAVDDAWLGDWPRQVVILAPASLRGLGALLGAPAENYRGIAAITTGETAPGTGERVRAPADRVLVNPQAYGQLGETGRQIVLTHEITHVATRAQTSRSTPLWLSEGFADWVGFAGSSRDPRDGAPELARAVAAGELPDRLPTDHAFRFGGDGDSLARAYGQAWLACRLIAERWGEAALRDVYRSAGAAPERQGAVEGALRDELGVDIEEFTRLWRGYLKERLG